MPGCFWDKCSNVDRCRDVGACVASMQAGGKNFGKTDDDLREIVELRSNQAAYEAIIGQKTYQQVADQFDYARKVVANNVDRCQDVIWDLKNKPEFKKDDPNVMGIIAVCEQMEASLSALIVDLS